MLGRQRGAQGVGAHRLRSALFVEHVEFCDGEARGPQQVDDWPGEVAAAEEPLLHRVEAVLPAAHSLVRGQPVLEEVQGPTGLEDPSQLAQGADSVGNGAQRPGGQGGVVTVVLERQ